MLERGFRLWIDGVGGYLVCMKNRITLGRAGPDGTAEVPILADVSRIHATLSRDSEGYLLEAQRAVQVNGKTVEKALLRNGDRVTLGACCQLQFCQPAPISASARLDLVSGHRLKPTVDGVLLMAEAVLLGPGEQVHVSIPDLKQPVILFRQKDGLGIRTGGPLTINGQSIRDRGLLGPGARVEAEEFSMTLEAV